MITDILIIIALLVAAMILMLTELFFIPGTSIAALISGCCVVSTVVFAFMHLGALGGFIVLIIATIVCILSVRWFMRSKTLDRISLKKDISSSIDRSAADSISVGDKGVTTTRLALIGNAEIRGHIVEVKSAKGLIDERSHIIVTRIADGIIMVEQTDNNS